MSEYTRTGRAADSLRNIKITPNFLPHADGSCLIECGNTKVILHRLHRRKMSHRSCAVKNKAG